MTRLSVSVGHCPVTEATKPPWLAGKQPTDKSPEPVSSEAADDWQTAESSASMAVVGELVCMPWTREASGNGRSRETAATSMYLFAVGMRTAYTERR